METSTPPHPTIDLPAHLYYQLVYTLTDLLPPPIEDTPEALRTRNLAAVAKVAALLPVNANEADLAAQCIAARAQAEDLLRLLRQNTDDIALVLRLNAQYSSMVRTSLSVHGRLMRVQASRQKREATEGAANQDAWTLHVAERSMLRVLDPTAGPKEAAWPEPPPPEAPIKAPAASAAQTTEKIVSEDETDSHDAAFETWLSEQPWNRAAEGPGKPGLGDAVRKAVAKLRLTGQDLPEQSEKPREGGPARRPSG